MCRVILKAFNPFYVITNLFCMNELIIIAKTLFSSSLVTPWLVLNILNYINHFLGLVKCNMLIQLEFNSNSRTVSPICL